MLRTILTRTTNYEGKRDRAGINETSWKRRPRTGWTNSYNLGRQIWTRDNHTHRVEYENTKKSLPWLPLWVTTLFKERDASFPGRLTRTGCYRCISLAGAGREEMVWLLFEICAADTCSCQGSGATNFPRVARFASALSVSTAACRGQSSN